MQNSFVKATSSLVGTIIGAGIFGVPYVMVQAGFWAGSVLFLALAGIMLILHLMYAEVVDTSGTKHRLTGYMDMYFGKRAKQITTVSIVLAVYGSMIVYILLANEFLNNLFGEIFSGRIYWGVVFWALLSIGIVKGIKTISKTETILLGFLGLVLLVITFRGAPLIEASNFNSFNFKNILVPYGVILFSLGGFQAIPEMRYLIGKDGPTFKRSVIAGVLFSAFVTFLFAFVVAGVSGQTTSPEAISGLEQFLGTEVIYLGSVLGLIAVATTYLIMGVNLKESFMYDWKIKPWKSDALLIAVPMAVVLLGVRDFISVIGIVGAVLGAVNGLFITLLFVKVKKIKSDSTLNLSVPNFVLMVIILALVLGGFYEIIKIIA